GLSGKGDSAKEILPPFMDRNDHVYLVTLTLEIRTGLIDHCIQETFSQIKALHETGAFFHIGGHEGILFLKSRISLASRSDHVIKQFIRRLVRVPVEDDIAHRKLWTLVDIQTQATRRFDRVMNIHLCVAVLSVENFKKERQIIRARRIQPKI